MVTLKIGFRLFKGLSCEKNTNFDISHECVCQNETEGPDMTTILLG